MKMLQEEKFPIIDSVNEYSFINTQIMGICQHKNYKYYVIKVFNKNSETHPNFAFLEYNKKSSYKFYGMTVGNDLDKAKEIITEYLSIVMNISTTALNSILIRNSSGFSILYKNLWDKNNLIEVPYLRLNLNTSDRLDYIVAYKKYDVAYPTIYYGRNILVLARMVFDNKFRFYCLIRMIKTKGKLSLGYYIMHDGIRQASNLMANYVKYSTDNLKMKDAKWKDINGNDFANFNDIWVYAQNLAENIET
jgi:hypothetical protein